VCVGHARRFLHLLACRVWLAVCDVVRNCPVEEGRLLPHQADLLPQPLKLQRDDVQSVEQHTTGIRIVKAQQQLHRCRFA